MIGMEDDTLHFPEGVHEDDVGTELVGVVTLREDQWSLLASLEFRPAHRARVNISSPSLLELHHSQTESG
jgi:hypothetical protein